MFLVGTEMDSSATSWRRVSSLPIRTKPKPAAAANPSSSCRLRRSRDLKFPLRRGGLRGIVRRAGQAIPATGFAARRAKSAALSFRATPMEMAIAPRMSPVDS